MPEHESHDEQVRRLLADARHTDPLPDDVADRLDGVLADLRADRPLRPAVTDLAAARRRRRARTMLVAAAAVVVVGLGIDQLRGMETGGADDSASSEVAGDADAGGTAAEQENSRRDELLDGGVAEEAAPQPSNDASADRVESYEFGAKALRLRAQRNAGAMSFFTSAKAQCIGADAGAGDAVPIRYDGSPAVLVYRAPRGDTQVVDLYVCGRDGVVRTITLPAP